MPVGVHSLGLIGAGISVADTHEISRHGILHPVSGGIGFLALTSASLVSVHRFNALQQRGRAVYSLITGIVFLATFFGIATGAHLEVSILVFVSLRFTAALVNAWAGFSVILLRLMSKTGSLI